LIPAAKDDGTDDVTDGFMKQVERAERLALLFKLGQFSHEFIDLVLNAFLE